MLKSKLEAVLNTHLNREAYSAYLYLSMSAWCAAHNLPGMAHWLRMQAQEEALHVTRFFDYVHARGGHVRLAAVDAPPTEWQGGKEIFAAALTHEELVTEYINELVEAALTERDHALAGFLQWFVNEQVEEEATLHDILAKFALAGDHPAGLFMLDKELAARPVPTLTPA